MSLHIAFTEPCPSCGRPTTITYGLHALNTRLHFWYSLHCSSCNCMLEADGYDDIPDDIRAQFIDLHGLWSLHLAKAPSRISLMRALLDHLSCPRADTLARARAIEQGEPIFTGLHTEAECLQSRFAELDIATHLSPHSPSRATDPT